MTTTERIDGSKGLVDIRKRGADGKPAPLIVRRQDNAAATAELAGLHEKLAETKAEILHLHTVSVFMGQAASAECVSHCMLLYALLMENQDEVSKELMDATQKHLGIMRTANRAFEICRQKLPLDMKSNGAIDTEQLLKIVKKTLELIDAASDKYKTVVDKSTLSLDLRQRALQQVDHIKGRFEYQAACIKNRMKALGQMRRLGLCK